MKAISGLRSMSQNEPIVLSADSFLYDHQSNYHQHDDQITVQKPPLNPSIPPKNPSKPPSKQLKNRHRNRLLNLIVPRRLLVRKSKTTSKTSAVFVLGETAFREFALANPTWEEDYMVYHHQEPGPAYPHHDIRWDTKIILIEYCLPPPRYQVGHKNHVNRVF